MLYLLPQAVDRAAQRDPDRDAVRCSGEALTWEELARRSDQLAGVLAGEGVRRGDRVGIHASKGLASAVAIHGIMKAGAAYVPLDPGAPRKRLGLIVDDCGIRHLVTEPARASTVAGLVEDGVGLECVVGVEDPELERVAGVEGPGPERVAGVEGPGPERVAGVEGAGLAPVRTVSWAEVEGAPARPPAVGTMEQDLAYVLYTSGSTGVPKGVMHTHRSALSFAEVAAQTYGFEAEDRLSNHAPLHFDLSTLDYFSAAVAGATTVIVPEAHTRLPASLSQLIEAERLTVLYAVPLALVQLLLHGALERRDLSSLRWVLFGGEPFPTKHLRGLMERLPGARFSNVYGPTEVNGVTYWIVPPLDDHDDEPIPIGRPYDNVETLVVDDDGQPVDPGETGELLVRTPTMMRGYWGRPDLNERAFFRRPAFGHYEDVFHRTGDLVRQRADGELMFLGRKDRQIKARGYRVELDEVEAALLSHHDVDVAAVFGVPDGHGSLRIEAAVILRPPGDTSPAGLVAHAARILPGYAVPERVTIVEEMPRTTTGKIDRLQLRDRAVAAAGAGGPT